ncbi:hypothetical protein QBC34DRAFT_91714 [Podospora aff. communis PSN243]|uniref:Secreted protein n=1 Tax=Podospora aff. communis PSN243 TaxID=3040156 RepID=A0AAV9GMS2_9PEZI|nr:hypothetical protein QBC34DRAFT_91714 [Podospora aff. communis PSN243]
MRLMSPVAVVLSLSPPSSLVAKDSIGSVTEVGDIGSVRQGFQFSGVENHANTDQRCFSVFSVATARATSGFGRALRVSGSASPLSRGRRGTLVRAVRMVNPSEWARLLLWRGDCARRKFPLAANSENRIGPLSERRQKCVSIQSPQREGWRIDADAVIFKRSERCDEARRQILRDVTKEETSPHVPAWCSSTAGSNMQVPA